MRVYISGKITGNDRYMEEFKRAQDMLEAEGYEVINPAAVCSMLPKGMKYEEYMKVCFKLLEFVDAVHLLSNWRDSKGANREYGFALAKGYTIMEELGGKEWE